MVGLKWHSRGVFYRANWTVERWVSSPMPFDEKSYVVNWKCSLKDPIFDQFGVKTFLHFHNLYAVKQRVQGMMIWSHLTKLNTNEELWPYLRLARQTSVSLNTSWPVTHLHFDTFGNWKEPINGYLGAVVKDNVFDALIQYKSQQCIADELYALQVRKAFNKGRF